MKKLFLLVVLAFFGVTSAFSQGLRFGVNAGIPVGDVSDFSSFQLGTDIAYMVPLVDVASVGPMVGYSHFFGKDDFDALKFVPLAVSGRFNILSLALGLDLGYALGISNDNDGGFYYRPQVGFNMGRLGLIASYQGINVNDVNVNSINLGVEFGM
ncbi:hypothetical protein BH23BAC2_BH23BAC2_10200 [soil metagenome]